MVEITNDQYGNYVIQKFIENCDKSYIPKIFEKVIIQQLIKIKNSLLLISVNNHGTRVFQKLLDHIYHENEYQILKDFLHSNFNKLIFDINGNHVIQKSLLIFNKNNNQFLYDEIAKNIIEISKIKQGGCIILKAFDNSNEEQKVI